MSFSTCVCMQLFSLRGHVTTFRQLSWAYICQMPGHILFTLAKGIPSELRLSIGTIGLLVWGKTVSYRLCAGQSKVH